MKKRIAQISYLIILLVLPYITMTVFHEATHFEIGRHHGCYQAEVGVDWVGPYYRCAFIDLDVGQAVINQGRLLHGWADIVAYHLLGLMYASIFYVLFFRYIRKV